MTDWVETENKFAEDHSNSRPSITDNLLPSCPYIDTGNTCTKKDQAPHIPLPSVELCPEDTNGPSIN